MATSFEVEFTKGLFSWHCIPVLYSVLGRLARAWQVHIPVLKPRVLTARVFAFTKYS